MRSRLPPAGRSLKCSRIELGWISGRVGVRCRSRHSRPGDPSSGFYRHQHARFHGRHKARRLQAIDGRPCTSSSPPAEPSPLACRPMPCLFRSPIWGAMSWRRCERLRICREDDRSGSSGFEHQADSLAKLSIVSIAYSQVSSVAAPSASSSLTSVLRAPDASASRAVGGSLLNPRSHEVWPPPPREGGRARRGAFPGPPWPVGFGLCSWIGPVGSAIWRKQVSEGSYVPGYGRSLPVCTRNGRNNA